jgi:hypothetical protein
VRLEIVAFEKLDRMRGNQRQLQLGRQIGRAADQQLLLRLSVALHFEVESIRGTGLPALRAQRRLFDCPAAALRQRRRPRRRTARSARPHRLRAASGG